MPDAPLPPAADPFERLRRLVATLRGPDGCPWDKSQTVDSVKRYLLEEVYEVLEALDAPGGAPPDVVRDELGDLLFQIAFLAQLHAERGAFDLAEVAERVVDKMTRRHPHVFAGRSLPDAEAVARSWSDLKAAERGERPGTRSLLDGVPKALPALEKALELTARAGAAGFDWPDAEAVLGKLDEELLELRAALGSPDRAARLEELGDLLFVVANLGRKLDLNPEEALQRANAKFGRRFRFIEDALRARGAAPGDATLDEMDKLWDEAKRQGR